MMLPHKCFSSQICDVLKAKIFIQFCVYETDRTWHRQYALALSFLIFCFQSNGTMFGSNTIHLRSDCYVSSRCADENSVFVVVVASTLIAIVSTPQMSPSFPFKRAEYSKTIARTSHSHPHPAPFRWSFSLYATSWQCCSIVFIVARCLFWF